MADRCRPLWSYQSSSAELNQSKNCRTRTQANVGFRGMVYAHLCLFNCAALEVEGGVSPRDRAGVQCHARRTEGEDLVGKGGRCHDFRRFSAFFFLSPKHPLIQLRSTMTCFHIPYLILSHVPSPLSYLLSSFGHFGQKVNSVISDCSG